MEVKWPCPRWKTMLVFTEPVWVGRSFKSRKPALIINEQGRTTVADSSALYASGVWQPAFGCLFRCVECHIQCRDLRIQRWIRQGWWPLREVPQDNEERLGVADLHFMWESKNTLWFSDGEGGVYAQNLSIGFPLLSDHMGRYKCIMCMYPDWPVAFGIGRGRWNDLIRSWWWDHQREADYDWGLTRLFFFKL